MVLHISLEYMQYYESKKKKVDGLFHTEPTGKSFVYLRIFHGLGNI